jgi:hypothetical protein
VAVPPLLRRGVETDAAVEWLLASPEPAIRNLARRDLLDEEPSEDVLEGEIVQALLREEEGHPYGKWGGAHWRLVSLVELGLPAGEPRAIAATDSVLAWLTGDGHRKGVQVIDGLARRCASQEGNALAVCTRLGLAGDPRVELLARSLVEWQWPDGGWNCDKKATGYRSSFNESLPPMWGLHEYAVATGATWAADAADRTAELFLEHRLFRSLRTGDVIHEKWLVAHYPPFWHYDVPQALLVLSRMGKASDPRAAEAVDLLVAARRDDGLWPARAPWWRKPGSAGSNVEVVDWGHAATAMVTLNALRILRSV